MHTRSARLLAIVIATTWLVLAQRQPLPAQLRVAPVGQRPDGAALELMLRKLANTGTFMQTDAHPDDEDNGLLAMLGHGRGIRTALVTLTRGDGGQNEIGPEIGQALGVLRTEELLAVHRFDGAEQYFTRALDFGFSFSIEESIEKWGHDEIVGDLVRHIRTVRPDVIAGFLCGGQSGGLHHQASAALTLEAFRAAADPARYPEQIAAGLRPWQAMRYLCTDETSFAPQPPPRAPDQVRPDLSAFDADLGRTYAELGLEARSMHKCQGTSQLLLLPGQSQNRTYRLQDSLIDFRDPAKGWAAPGDLFVNIDTSIQGLERFAMYRSPELKSGLAAIATSIDAARAALPAGRSGVRTALIAGLRAVRVLRGRLATVLTPPPGGLVSSGPPQAFMFNPDAQYEIDTRLAIKERQFQDALALAANLRLEALADDGVVVGGQAVTVSMFAAGVGELRGVTLAGFTGQPPVCAGALVKPVTCQAAQTVPANTHLSTPYWTPRQDSARYDFEADVPFGVPFRPSPFRATFNLTIGGEPVTVDRVVEYRYSNLVAGEKRSELNVAPAFDVTVDPDIVIVPLSNLPPEGGSHQIPLGSSVPSANRAKVIPRDNAVASALRRKVVRVTVANNQKGAALASVALQTPAGWRVEPASAPLSFAREDEQTTVTFILSPPAALVPGEVAVSALVSGNGAASALGYQVVEYPHIHRRQVIQAAAARVKVLDVTIAADLQVGYIMGVGDKVPEAIAQLGAKVTLIDAKTMASGDLSPFDVIVLGVRAYERRLDLRAHNTRLLQYAGNGGTVVVQYQRTEFNDAQYGPFAAKTTAERVTDEHAPIEVLAPEHPVFNRPNAIGPETWRGWVQERGTYFLGPRDPRYVDLLRSQDPFPYNAGVKSGMLVEARVGKGRWIYTGLGLWRQLPAGTDGAYRLMANLLSLGKR